MSAVYFFSGACGCGKTALTTAYAKRLVNVTAARQVYLIHGDDFHAGFIESGGGECAHDATKTGRYLRREEILPFIWDCVIDTADKALSNGLDVLIDYIAETELPRVVQLARKHGAKLYYIVLTASEDCIRRRMTARGDTELIDRALFLKHELESAAENQGHLFDNTGLSVQEEIERLDIERYLLE